MTDETVTVQGFKGRRGTAVHFVPKVRRTVYLVQGGRILPGGLVERQRPASARFRVVPWVEAEPPPPLIVESTTQGTTVLSEEPKAKRRKARK